VGELTSQMQNSSVDKFEDQVKYWQNELRLQENLNHEIIAKYNDIASENTNLVAANDILEKMNRGLTESNLT
jgi:hypothetical protein